MNIPEYAIFNPSKIDTIKEFPYMVKTDFGFIVIFENKWQTSCFLKMLYSILKINFPQATRNDINALKLSDRVVQINIKEDKS